MLISWSGMNTAISATDGRLYLGRVSAMRNCRLGTLIAAAAWSDNINGLIVFSLNPSFCKMVGPKNLQGAWAAEPEVGQHGPIHTHAQTGGG